MLKIYFRVVLLAASVVICLYVCPRMISYANDSIVLLGIVLLILFIPFAIWQLIRIIKSIIKNADKIEKELEQ